MRHADDSDFDLSDGPLDGGLAAELLAALGELDATWHPDDRVALGPDPRALPAREDRLERLRRELRAAQLAEDLADGVLCRCPACGSVHLRRDDLDPEDARPRDPMAHLDVREQVGPVLTEPASRTPEEWEARARRPKLEIAYGPDGKILVVRVIDEEVA